PAMTPTELATTIVHRYAEHYGADGPDATQSAIDLAKLDDLVGAVDGLARALLGALPSASVELTLYTAWRRSLRFLDGLYVDLRHVAQNLGGASTRSDVRRACAARLGKDPGSVGVSVMTIDGKGAACRGGSAGGVKAGGGAVSVTSKGGAARGGSWAATPCTSELGRGSPLP